jgi:OMF family outer membrane factor
MLNTLRYISLFLLLMAIPSWSSTIYSREEAIKIALEKSSSIQEAEQSLKSATAQVDQAYGNAYPSIDLSVQYARTFGVSDVEESASISEMLDASAD